MSMHDKTNTLRASFLARGITLENWAVNELRRAQQTLHAWDEQEMGDSDTVRSVIIQRDETTGVPYRVVRIHRNNTEYRTKIADREKGALKRVAAICKAHGLYYYHQPDCRGCSLYIAAEPLTDSAYTNGVPCSV